MSRAALTILRVRSLALLRDDLEVGRRDLRMVALNVCNALVVPTAVLASQATVGGVDITSRVDPVEVDVGRGEPGESAKGKN